MSTEHNKRLSTVGLLVALLAAAAGIGLWYSMEPAVHADKAEAVGEDVLATVGEIEIREADLEEANADGFMQLRRERHDLLEQTLDGVIKQKLLELEAAATGVTVEALTAAEVDNKITMPTDAEVDAFYESNKSRINQPKEGVSEQIRQYLAGQARTTTFNDYVDSLRAKYAVERYLDPLRVEVASAGFPYKGGESALVTIVEFSDFECPYCSRVVPTLDRVTEEYGDKVRLVFRQFPLHQIHPNAQKAAEASLCANDQDKFWAMHDTMFQEQKALGVDQLKEKAARIGLEVETFNECLDSGKYADQVLADVAEGRSAGVTGTPAMFINGRFLNGAQPYEEIARVIDDELERLQ